MSLGSGSNKPATNGTGTKSIKDLEKEKVQASIWGSNTHTAKPSTGSNSLFGASSVGAGTGGSGSGATTGSFSSGGDDLLL